MKIELLVEIVKRTYKYLFNEDFLSLDKVNDKLYFVKFKDEVIKVDNSVGNKYRLTFESYEGTIDSFRSFFNQVLESDNYCCDTSYFIDLTASFINRINAYINEIT